MIEAPPPNENPDDAIEREPKKIKTGTEKGALWHEYDFLVHQFVAHLRSVRPVKNKAIMMEIIPNTSTVLVKAADPLEKQEIPLYYTHSKTFLYNNVFFQFKFWDTVMAPTLSNICQWMAVTSKKSLEQLFNLEFHRFVLTPIHFVEACQLESIAVFGCCSTKSNFNHPSLAFA
jgi:hypothetical protein